MAMNHADDRDCAAYQNCADRNQQATQAEDSIHEIVHASVPSGAKARNADPPDAALKGRALPRSNLYDQTLTVEFWWS